MPVSLSPSPAPIRRAPQNPSYRLVERSDLRPGAVLLMLDSQPSEHETQRPWQQVTLDAEPIRVRNGVEYVFYHCTMPAWDGQCFVPLRDVLGDPEDAYHASLYWLPIYERLTVAGS